ncbi:hypothetical protein MIR68_009890 [Amoeboaphelidium protococcarum]|nr:hypothetical protein MIR68_009890 [Amoeboaphelidium protococcarum]
MEDVIEVESLSKLFFIIHGILMTISWLIVVPLAIVFALLRAYLIHGFVALGAAILMVIAFVFAAVGTMLDFHLGGLHQIAGFLLFFFTVFVQVPTGIFSLLKSQSDQADVSVSTGNPRATGGGLINLFHKLSGHVLPLTALLVIGLGILALIRKSSVDFLQYEEQWKLFGFVLFVYYIGLYVMYLAMRSKGPAQSYRAIASNQSVREKEGQLHGSLKAVQV